MECSPPECPDSVTVRRNPHRRARPTPSTTAIDTPSSRNHNVPNFPLTDILSMDVENPQNPSIPSIKPPSNSSSDSLNVFLRVRPLPILPSKSSKIKQLKTKKPPNKSILTVNDSHSITISPPICDSNRLKSEAYNGFSHVFSSDSSQDEVYDKLMRPMVEEFLNGRSGLLAALGPSGSGKTHTVFGSAKEPGLVPRALHHIFNPQDGNVSTMSRSFYLSIFEIYSEKGKGEKLLDLSPDGSDIYMQQSVVKGLKEIMVKDVAQAESLLAHAKSKRVTAMTNSNSYSSRSQCIINIRFALGETEGQSESLLNQAVLTFVDLAGAEREKKTGNKGGRLLESNFINNTSMVFGLCLRSLLDHQKNPKKPLQKHFQSSMLTRYLRDYLEGRKRMALILTVRSGEEDYFDTCFLLRQASPYMEIKFRDMEETSNLPRIKRRHDITGNEKQKRAKLSGTDGKEDVRMTSLDSDNSQKGVESIDILGGNKRNDVPKVHENLPPKVHSTDSNIQRQYHVMQGFAKALWVALKQCKERVKVMQNDIDILTENLRMERAQNLVMKEELRKLKCQPCRKQVLVVSSCNMEGPNTEERSAVSPVLEKESRSGSMNSKMAELQETGSANVLKVHLGGPPSGSKSFLSVDEFVDTNDILTRPAHNTNLAPTDVKMSSPESHLAQKSLVECQISHDMSENGCHEKDLNKESAMESTDAVAHLPGSHVIDVIGQRESCGYDTQCEMDKENVANGPGSNFNSELETKESSHYKPKAMSQHELENGANGTRCGFNLVLETKETSPSQPAKAKRPKRRLMPASSLLLRDAASIDFTDENVNLKKHLISFCAHQRVGILCRAIRSSYRP